jgi:uncharacterized protein involved in type VI secretion and phage assembly
VTTSLLDSMRRVAKEEIGRPRMPDVARVTDIHPSDPDNYACSLQLRDSAIVLNHVPVATGKLGLAHIPAIGDMVLVQFVGGDINSPIVVGSLYNNQDRPPASKDGQCVLHLPLGAKDADAAHIEVSSVDKRKLIVRMGSTEVTIQDGDPAVSIDVGGNAKLTIGSNGAVKVQSSAGLDLKADGDMKIEAGGTLTLKGATVNIN